MPENTTIKVPLSNEVQIFIDTTPSGAQRTYARLGKGFTSFTPTNNPQSSTKQYIDEVNATTAITSLQKQFAYSAERAIGDPANDYIASCEDKVGDDLKTTMIKVETFATGNNATLYNCVIAPGNTGDLAGGSTLAMSGTVYVNGDSVKGTWSNNTFTPASSV